MLKLKRIKIHKRNRLPGHSAGSDLRFEHSRFLAAAKRFPYSRNDGSVLHGKISFGLKFALIICFLTAIIELSREED